MDESQLKEKRFINPFSRPIPFCWELINSKTKRYSNVYFKGRVVRVHRLSAHFWLDFDLDSNLEICHKCDNTRCFNPEHLFIGTHQDNMIDASKKKRFNPVKDYSKVESKNSKLDSEDIEQIRKLAYSKELNSKEIAEVFKISISQVNKILNKTAWSFV